MSHATGEAATRIVSRWRTALILGLTRLTTLSIAVVVLAAESHPKPMLGGVEPDWLLEWEAPAPSADLSPRQALIDGVHARHLADNSLRPSAHISIVMDGPTFAQAVVQLDPDGRFGSLVTVTRQQSGAAWVEEQGSLSYITHAPPCSRPTQASSEFTFLGAVCSGVGVMRSPTESYVNWTAANSRQFFAYRVTTSVQRPAAGSVDVQIGANTGWMIQDGAVTSVVVPVTPEETFAAVAIGAGGAQQIVDVGAEFLGRFQLLRPDPILPPQQ